MRHVAILHPQMTQMTRIPLFMLAYILGTDDTDFFAIAQQLVTDFFLLQDKIFICVYLRYLRMKNCHVPHGSFEF